jgi:F0F1-type ATP synthase assembly protein I
MVGLGVFLAAAVVVPMVVGGLLDAAFKTGPAFLLLGLLVGIAAAVGGAYMRVKRFL